MVHVGLIWVHSCHLIFLHGNAIDTAGVEGSWHQRLLCSLQMNLVVVLRYSKLQSPQQLPADLEGFNASCMLHTDLSDHEQF